MIYSEKIALARSSLSQAILQLSPVQKRFWVCEEHTDRGGALVLSAHTSFREFERFERCRVSAQFQERVMSFWVHSPEQKKMILTEACEWDVVGRSS
jgi:hypothetical protein